MNRKRYLMLMAAVCALTCTACGSRREQDRTEDTRSQVTTIHTGTQNDRSHVGEEVSEMASDAVDGVSEAVSDAAGHGRELMTDAARDVSEEVSERRGDGDYDADDDGRVEPETKTRTSRR